MQQADTIDIDNIDTEAFSRRLANLLVATREQRGESLRHLAKMSDGRFSRADLKQLEAGATVAKEETVERVAELYRADLGAILPTRLPVSVGEGELTAGGVSMPFVPHDPTSLLTSYLRLVRSMRRQTKAPAVDLRREDIEVLAVYLEEPGEMIIDRLAALMGSTRVQRSAMAALFASGAVVIGLVGAAAATAPDTTVNSTVVSANGSLELVVPQPPTTSAPVVSVPVVSVPVVSVPTPVAVPAPADVIPTTVAGPPVTTSPAVIASFIPAPVVSTAPQSQPSAAVAPPPVPPVADPPIDEVVPVVVAVADPPVAPDPAAVLVADPPPVIVDPIVDVGTPPATTILPPIDPAADPAGGAVGEPPIDLPVIPVIDPATVAVGLPPVPTTIDPTIPVP